MTITLVGVFDTMKEAQQARSRLQAEGVADASISVKSDTDASPTTPRMASTANSGDDVDRRDFWDKLFGWMSDDEDDADRRTSTQHYDEAVRRGNALLIVRLDDASRADRISDLLNECGAVDVDERVAEWRATGYEGPAQHGQSAADGSIDGDQTLQSIEEQLKVGKKTVQHGRVRIHRTMSERPVEEQVTLHEERVRVERTPVDRAATEADLAGAFEDRNIEFTETAEEAVVGKTARVIEEVRVRTEATDRVETVRDTVRKTEIDVEQVDDNSTGRRGAASGRLGDSDNSAIAANAGRAGNAGNAGATSRMTGGSAGLAGSSGMGGLQQRGAGYGGAERRHASNANYRGPERRMAA